MRRMTAVITCCDSAPVAEEALEYLRLNSDPELTELVLFDNGSTLPLDKFQADRVVRVPANVGGNAPLHRMLEHMDTEFVAYFHNDFMMVEKDWDKRVIACFDADPKLGLIGTVGSDMQDDNGGRGYGTSLNYMGNMYRTGWASPSEHHGRRFTGLEPAAVLDHCSLIFRTSVLKQITPQEGTYAPSHFYDRVVSCTVWEMGYRVGMLGLQCDHFSGGIGLCKAPGIHTGLLHRNDLYRRWFAEQGLPYTEEGMETDMFLASQSIFMKKWNNEKAFIPYHVDANWNIIHTNPRYK